MNFLFLPTHHDGIKEHDICSEIESSHEREEIFLGEISNIFSLSATSTNRLPYSTLLWPRKGQTLDNYIRECDLKTRTDVEKVTQIKDKCIVKSSLFSRRMRISISAKQLSPQLNKSNLRNNVVNISVNHGHHP